MERCTEDAGGDERSWGNDTGGDGNRLRTDDRPRRDVHFGLIVHHTDAAREWASDRASHIGTLARGLDEAGKRGWTVVDMRQDWKVIYPWQK